MMVVVSWTSSGRSQNGHLPVRVEHRSAISRQRGETSGVIAASAALKFNDVFNHPQNQGTDCSIQQLLRDGASLSQKDLEE